MATVTCQTTGCINNGIPIDMTLTYVDEDTGETVAVDSVVCGPCGQPINVLVNDERTSL